MEPTRDAVASFRGKWKTGKFGKWLFEVRNGNQRERLEENR
jgi:hypothetical protein